MSCYACGSFRRGELTCGDVDILIGPSPGVEFANILSIVLDTLRASGFLTDDLALPKAGAIDHASYMGVCKLNSPVAIHRRIDIKEYSRSLYPFALLYFTGSDIFNRLSYFFVADLKILF
jgi:DNA polymerase lambda